MSLRNDTDCDVLPTQLYQVCFFSVQSYYSWSCVLLPRKYAKHTLTNPHTVYGNNQSMDPRPKTPRESMTRPPFAAQTQAEFRVQRAQDTSHDLLSVLGLLREHPGWT